MRTNGPVLATVVFAVLGAIAMASPATSQTDALHVTPGGNVGIGTASPSEPVHVLRTDASRTTLLVENSNASAQNADVILKNTISEWAFRNNRPGNFVLQETADGALEMALTPDGDLTIAGDYFSTACSSPTPCTPDYVFEPDYALLPIADLAAFVRENKHLPNVPSESELRAAGQLNMSRFQMTLLEKIEELTLYTLAQEETIAGLKASEAENARLLRDRLARVEQVLGLAGQ